MALNYNYIIKQIINSIHLYSTYLPFNTHTTEYFKNAKILKLTDLYESQISKHMFKCLNLNANILSRHSDTGNIEVTKHPFQS